MSENQDALTLRTDDMLRELAPIGDIPMRVSIEIGRMRLRVRDLLKLSPGAVIEVKKPAGEPFEICINGVPVARCEVVSVEQSSGVRIIEVQKPGGMNA